MVTHPSGLSVPGVGQRELGGAVRVSGRDDQVGVKAQRQGEPLSASCRTGMAWAWSLVTRAPPPLVILWGQEVLMCLRSSP